MTLGEIVGSLPDAIRLVGRLLLDKRVPPRARLAAGMAAAYAVTPIDLVPDRIRFLGKVDDALVIALALHILIESAGDDVIDEHWLGTPEALVALRGGLDTAVRLVPARIRMTALGVAQR